NTVFTEESEADFILLNGTDSARPIEQAKVGTLAYPELSATLLIQVREFSTKPLPESIRLSLVSPGIPGKAEAFVAVLDPAFLAMLKRKKSEFSLGLDAVLTSDSISGDPCSLALPRTTTIRWDNN